MAALSQLQQGLPQCLKRVSLAAQFISPCQRKRLYVCTRTVAVAPESKKLADILYRKAKVSRVGDESQPVHVGIRIIAIPAVTTSGRRDQADLLIMADHPLRDPARCRGSTDVHSFTRLRRRALVTTLADDSAIAAAAIIGDSRMPKNG